MAPTSIGSGHLHVCHKLRRWDISAMVLDLMTWPSMPISWLSRHRGGCRTADVLHSLSSEVQTASS